MQTILYILFAAVALGVLVFIHEWGHYWMSNRVGMKVEVFSIGFGKPIKQWMRGDVRWQLCVLPFGGYVKITGMEMGRGEPSAEEKAHGFYAKKPLDRIKVAFAGPCINILFAFLVFTAIWLCGGRSKPFAEFTSFIGWVDPSSDAFKEGLRPGDELKSYDGHPFTSSKDLVFAAMFGGQTVKLSANRYATPGSRAQPINIEVRPMQVPGAPEGLRTIGITSPARYLIYGSSNHQAASLPLGSPLQGSGIIPGDRIVWMNGEYLYSLEQMSYLLNTPKTLLTIERGNKRMLARVPRIKIGEMRLDAEHRAELTDWQHEAGMRLKLPFLYFIPYNLSFEGVVEGPVDFIDEQIAKESVALLPLSYSLDQALLPGDRVVAVNGEPVTHARQILKDLQEQKALIMVQRSPLVAEAVSWKLQDSQFISLIDMQDIEKIEQSIGTVEPLEKSGSYILLKTVTPKAEIDFDDPFMKEKYAERRRMIDAMRDAEKRAKVLQAFEEMQKRLLIGVPLQDKYVEYNPNPLALFSSIAEETYRTLAALLKGSLSPKWVSGPVGIVQVMQQGWMLGPLEALFWIGAISLNLAFLNLLPLPVLDGGYIVFSLVELCRGKPIKARTMERIILPFMLLLIAFLIFVTYHDLARIF